MNSKELVRLTRTKKLPGKFLVASNDPTRPLPGTSTLLPMPGPRWYRRHRYTVPAGGDSLLLTIVARAPSMSPFTFVVWRPGSRMGELVHDDLLFALPR